MLTKIPVESFAAAKMTEKLHMVTFPYLVEVRNENVNELYY